VASDSQGKSRQGQTWITEAG